MDSQVNLFPKLSERFMKLAASLEFLLEEELSNRGFVLIGNTVASKRNKGICFVVFPKNLPVGGNGLYIFVGEGRGGVLVARHARARASVRLPTLAPLEGAEVKIFTPLGLLNKVCSLVGQYASEARVLKAH